MTVWRQIYPAARAVAAAVAWLAKTGHAFAVTAPVSGVVKPSAAATAAVAQTPTYAVTGTNSGTSAASPAAGTAGQMNTGEAVSAAVTLRNILASPTEAMRVSYTKYDLVQTTYCTVATATGSWAAAGNAQGAPDGVLATNTNSVTTAGSGVLTLAFAGQVSKTALTLTSATVDLFWSAGYTVPLSAGSCVVQCSTDAGSSWFPVYSATTAADHITTPSTFDITRTVAGSWPKLTNLLVSCTFTADASALTSTMSVDAVRLNVTATLTTPN